MLNSVLKDAIQNRDQTLSILKGPKFDQIIQKSKDNWIEHAPQKEDVISAGIDSSFNSTKFQGAELWAVTAVSVKSDGEILVDLHEFGLDINPQLASLASKMEIEACKQTVENADLVLMDGSLYSQFMTRQKDLTDSIVSSITKSTKALAIIILSAIGSKSSPSLDSSLYNLANNPSKKSVKLANTNIKKGIQSPIAPGK